LTNKTEDFIDALLKPINPAAIIFLGIFTVVWGLWVVSPFWTVFDNAQLFSALGLVAPEVFWGCLALLCGSITIWGAWKRSYRSLTSGSATAFFHWLMIAIFYFIGDWQNTGGIVSLCFAIYAAFVWLNIRVNFRVRNKDIDEILS
jgi:hypothetical protein